MSSRSISHALCVVGAVAAGFFAGYVDLHNDEVQAAVLIVAVSAFVLSAIRPRGAWVYAVILGGSIPLAHVYARATDYALPYKSSLPGTLLAFIPAFVGAYVAVWVRRMTAPAHG